MAELRKLVLKREHTRAKIAQLSRGVACIEMEIVDKFIADPTSIGVSALVTAVDTIEKCHETINLSRSRLAKYSAEIAEITFP